MLHLDRPLVLFDLEATGVDPAEARIIQMAFTRLEPTDDGTEAAETHTVRVDPGTPIPPEVTDLTGIADADVQGAPSFAERLAEVEPLLRDADLAGYNVLAYDVPLLKAECERAGVPLPGPDDRRVLDVYKLEHVLVPRTLSALFERYTGTPLDDAHDAEADVRATLDVLNAQLRTHQPDATTPAALVDLIRGEYLDDNRRLKRIDAGMGAAGVEVCFGKHAGKTLAQIQEEDPGYLDWMRKAIDDLRPHIEAAFAEEAAPEDPTSAPDDSDNTGTDEPDATSDTDKASEENASAGFQSGQIGKQGVLGL